MFYRCNPWIATPTWLEMEVLHYKHLFMKKQMIGNFCSGCWLLVTVGAKKKGKKQKSMVWRFQHQGRNIWKGLVLARASFPVIRAWRFVDFVVRSRVKCCHDDYKHLTYPSFQTQKNGNNQRSAAGSSLHWLHLTSNSFSHSKPPNFQRSVAWKATNALSTMMAYWQKN